MCYSALVRTDLEQLEKEFGAQRDQELWDRVYESFQANPKKVRFPEENRRIFPGYYTGVLTVQGGTRKIVPMRYSAYAPEYMDESVSRKLSTFNARRDSLDKRFWSHAFLRQHGLLLIEGFYEWVSVRDLVQAGVVSLSEIKKAFEHQSLERKERMLAAGKKYRPTATEQKDPLERQTVIEFRASSGDPILAPAICSQAPSGDFGFALITDEPTQEIQAAGHDRMPINLHPAMVEEWLHVEKLDRRRVEQMFDEARREIYVHTLAEAA